MSKTCNRCKVNKDSSCFWNDVSKKDGLSTLCKDCKNISHKKYYEENRKGIIAKVSLWQKENIESVREKSRGYRLRHPGAKRNQHRNHRYEITELEYEFILQKQNGKCAICNGVSANGKSLCVDHDHENGNIRGLLCIKCNTGIGLLRDSKDIMKKAIAYLDRKPLIIRDKK